jgi:hypothetical protein
VAGLLAAIFLLLAALATVVLFAFDPGHYSFYPVCILHRTTGLFCPGCGSLRAVHQLLHGHLAAAFHFNALLVLSLPALAWFLIRFALRAPNHGPASVSFRPSLLWCALAVVLAFGIVRNLPFAAHAGLTP